MWKYKPKFVPITSVFLLECLATSRSSRSQMFFKIPYRWKKNWWKVTNFFSVDQYFSPNNNFIRLKLTPTKNFYQFVFLLNKNQITEIFKKNYQIYNTIIWLISFEKERVVKKGKFKKNKKLVEKFLIRKKRCDISREKFLVMFITLSRQKVVL